MRAPEPLKDTGVKGVRDDMSVFLLSTRLVCEHSRIQEGDVRMDK